MALKSKVAVVGGGAAGLLAAIVCARRLGGENVLLLEKSARVGKKLLATGNGTCNLSNIHASSASYHGQAASFVNAALSAFSPQDAIAFFESIGVACEVRENGRVYPLCAQAGAVLDCLRAEIEACGVQVMCDTEVTALIPQKQAVLLQTASGAFAAEAVLVAVGGAASPSLGGSAAGYGLLTALGHKKTPLFPAIVQIKTEKERIRAVKGVRVDAALSLQLDGRPIAQSSGEILFADYGVSGPAAMAIGRVAADWERRKKGDLVLCLDLLPTWTREQVKASLTMRRALFGRTLENMLTGLLQKRLGQTLLKAAGLQPFSRSVQTLTDRELDRLADTVKNFPLRVVGSAGFDSAQVTAGGMETSEFDPHTMRSRICPRVYAAGEVLDVDGDCGGFNLQWAWSSAYAAATAITEAQV